MSPSGPHRPRHAQAALDGFCDKHRPSWQRIAYLHTGSPAAAKRITKQVAATLDVRWEEILQRRNVEQQAWCILKVQITMWLRANNTESKFVQTAAFDRASRPMEYAREKFDVMAECLGLFSAIAALPERQFDVITLSYALEYSDTRIADYLGIDVATVRSNLRHARHRLEAQAVRLGLLNTTRAEG